MDYEISNNAFDFNETNEAGSKITKFGKIYEKDGTILFQDFEVKFDKNETVDGIIPAEGAAHIDTAATVLISLLIKQMQDALSMAIKAANDNTRAIL